MSWSRAVQLLQLMHKRLSPQFRYQLEAELVDLVTRYLDPLQGAGPPR